MRRMLLKASVCLLTGLMGGAMLMGNAMAQQKLEPLSVRLDWTPWGVHGAFHLAQQKGWYKDAGLDVTMEDGNGSVTTVQIVGSSDRFDVGHAALSSMMIARDKGLPVKAVAPFARRSDIGVLVPKDSGITDPSGLKGKKLVYTAGSLEAPFMDSFLKAGNLTRNDVELLNVEAAGKMTTYAMNRADAVVSTIPFVMSFAEEKRPSNAILFADYGLNMPSFGIFASEDKLAKRADAISKFASVTARAWEYIYDGHQDEAVAAIIAQRPQARLDPKTLRTQIDVLYDYFGKPGKGDRVGIPVPADWDQAVETLTSVDLIGKNSVATDFYVTDLVHPERFDATVAQ